MRVGEFDVFIKFKLFFGDLISSDINACDGGCSRDEGNQWLDGEVWEWILPDPHVFESRCADFGEKGGCCDVYFNVQIGEVREADVLQIIKALGTIDTLHKYNAAFSQHRAFLQDVVIVSDLTGVQVQCEFGDHFQIGLM